MLGCFMDQLCNLKLKDYLTLGNAASGALAIAMALARDPLAWTAIILGILFDAADGFVARRRVRGKATANAFGLQLDSLADCVTFGLAPVAIALSPIINGGPLFVTAPLAVLTFAAGIFYLGCVLTRLALFNLQKNGNQYLGLPSPVAALFVVLVSALWLDWAWLALAVAGALAVSSFEIPKPKL